MSIVLLRKLHLESFLFLVITPPCYIYLIKVAALTAGYLVEEVILVFRFCLQPLILLQLSWLTSELDPVSSIKIEC